MSTRPSGIDNTTHYSVTQILSLYGLSFAKIKQWGGTVQETPRPTSPERLSGIRTGKINAIFDEGLHNWLDEALDHGFEVLPIERKILKQLSTLGYEPSVIPSTKFKQLKTDVDTIDFSGWPLITHRGFSNDLAYAICEAIDARQGIIPIDDESPLDMKKIARATEAAPLGIPLHPGAKRYYQEKGYL